MKRAMVGILAAAAALVACTDDGTGPGGTGDALTREEALALTNRLVEASTDAGTEAYDSSQSSASLSASSATRSSAEPKNITIDHTSSHPCPVSGRVAFELSLDVAWESEQPSHDFSYGTEGTLTADACAFVEDDVTFTVDGDPGLAFEAHAASVGGDLEPFTAEASGALDWSASDGRSGQCVIDLAAETDFAERHRVVQGEVCGHTIDQTITWSGS